MATQSINTLQNSDNYNNIAKEYILESLANLGQRYNVKGDSISIDKFSISKLLGINSNDIDNLVAVIYKESDTYHLRVSRANDLTNYIDSYNLSTQNKKVNLDSFNLDNNHARLYSGTSFFSNDDYYGLYSREDVNTSLNKTVFMNYLINKENDTLVRGVRVYKKLLNSIGEDNYILFLLDKTSDTSYMVYWFLSKLNTESILESEIGDFVSGLELSKNYNELKTDIENQFDLIFSAPISYESGKFVSTSEFLSIVSDVSEDQELLEHNLLDAIKYDIDKLYPVVKEKYSYSLYGSLESVYFKLLVELYDEIMSTDGSGKYIYIPLQDKEGNPYSITYTYNTNREEEIYFAGHEIEVRFVSDEITNDWMEVNIENYKGSIISGTDSCSKVSFYYFESELYNDSIISIDARKISTLPYIDDNNYWVINDVSTGIKARGRDAGNPNIIIVETLSLSRENTEVEYKILSGSKKSEILENLSWVSKIAKVEPLEKINLDNLSFKNEFDYFQVPCAIPDTTKIAEINKEDYFEHLENSIIICITPVSLILSKDNSDQDSINYSRDDIYEIYGQYGIVTTLWSLDEESNEFDYLRKRNNDIAAADFNYLSNINNLIQYAVKNTEPIHPDNFEFTKLVFDPTTATLKNNTVEERTYLYPNISNKTSGQYNISNYNNDLNFVIRYNDIMIRSTDNRNIESLTQSGDLRYYNSTYSSSDSNSANIVTNSLYSYYESGLYGKYFEYIPNYNIPSVDFSEVITRNQTLLNRLNILSFDSSGSTYLSYIGTKYDSSNKGILTIGSTNTNINMGSETLISDADKDTFLKQNEIDIDFDKVNIHGNANVDGNLTVNSAIYSNGLVWNKDYLNIKTNAISTDTTYYTTIYTPTARYIYELNDHKNIRELISYNTYLYENENLRPISAYLSSLGFGPVSSGIVELDTTNSLSLSSVTTRMAEENAISDLRNQSARNKKEMNALLKSLTRKELYDYSVNKNKLYTITVINEYYLTRTVADNKMSYKSSSNMIYIGDGIYIPVLLSQIGLSDFVKTKTNSTDEIDMSNIVLTSNMEIIKVNGNPILVISTSTNLLPDKYVYNKNEQMISNFTGITFTANPLKITYYTIGLKLFINIEELYGRNKFNTYKKLIHEYTVI